MHVKTVGDETSSRWCGVVVREGCQLASSTSLDHGSKLRGPTPPKSPRVAEQCDVNIQSINRRSSKATLQGRQPQAIEFKTC
ncbi:hypothetical protein TNCV_1756101 [Trichonephila clavipes]|nr:hypothetical protein TNCV_1756101 [Trichonephila clavipes]